MYGLPQAGIIAKVGYHQSKIIPGLWMHKTRNICFTLVVDDFAIKYVKKEDADHLLTALQKDYTVSTDWEATKYIGLTIEWDYQNRKVHIHMPGYLAKALQRFKHPTPTRQQNSPHPHIAPQYGAKVQYTPDDDESPPLTRRTPNTSRRWRGHCYTMGELSTTQSLPHSAQSRPNRPNQRRKQWK
jgi:hypothetical protein